MQSRKDINKILYPYRNKGDSAYFINVWFVFVIVAVVVVLPISLFTYVKTGIAAANEKTRIRVQQEYDQMVLSTVVPAMHNAYSTAVQSYVTPSPIPTNTPMGATATAVYTPTGTAIQTLTFKLSFYDPAIGRIFPDIAFINCAVWDTYLQDCTSKVNHGRDHYSLWYRRGVACPAPFVVGQKLRILSPFELAAISSEWVCIDRGGAIVDGYLDFMLRFPDDIWSGPNLNDFPWNYPVVVELIP